MFSLQEEAKNRFMMMLLVSGNIVSVLQPQQEYQTFVFNFTLTLISFKTTNRRTHS